MFILNGVAESQGVKLIGFFRALEDYMLDFLFFNCNTAELAFTVDSDYKDYHKDKLVISTIGKLYGLDYIEAGLDSGRHLDFEFLV